MKIANIVKLIATLFFVTNISFAAWSGGTSQPSTVSINGASYYKITNSNQLAWFASKVNSGATTINAVLANDILFGDDISGKTSTAWSIIGNSSSRQYAGIFDGQNHTIYGLKKLHTSA